MQLDNGSRIAVVGGGPAGSFSAYFLLDMAQRAGISLSVDIFEPKDFSRLGPAGCNHCGGIVSESLLQMLAAEGIILPDDVVMQGIEAYVVHSLHHAIRIAAPSGEKRIAAVYRGGGPRGGESARWSSFDGHLLSRARSKGANVVPARVEALAREGGRPTVTAGGADHGPYDLLIGATGLDAKSLGMWGGVGFGFAEPRTMRTAIHELHLGENLVKHVLRDAMHVFLMDIPGLEFAAIIPKREYATIALLGEIDKDVLERFIEAEPVRELFPTGVDLSLAPCQCKPRINMGARGAVFGDRVALVGDLGVSRLYKDGIGAAYRVSKALAATAVFHGVSAEALKRHFQPACRRLAEDNLVGKGIFACIGLIRRNNLLRHATMSMAEKEQRLPPERRVMSSVMWDAFTGSAPYADILLRTLRPEFIPRFGAEIVRAAATSDRHGGRVRMLRRFSQIGKSYPDGAVIVAQGDIGEVMYVLQKGQVELVHVDDGGREEILNVLDPGETFGEMSLFSDQPATVTIRAKGEARVLSVDKRLFLQRIQEDPSLAFHLLRRLSQRLQSQAGEIVRLRDLLDERAG